jgi:hypothetical protein
MNEECMPIPFGLDDVIAKLTRAEGAGGTTLAEQTARSVQDQDPERRPVLSGVAERLGMPSQRAEPGSVESVAA